MSRKLYIDYLAGKKNPVPVNQSRIILVLIGFLIILTWSTGAGIFFCGNDVTDFTKGLDLNEIL
jgi:hypothetical protein